MDHSIRGYLERRTTEELRELLKGYQEESISEWDMSIKRVILDILEKRTVCNCKGQ